MARRSFFIGGGSGAGAAPTLGTPVPLEHGSNWIEFTWTDAFTTVTGDVLIAALGRANGGAGIAPSAVLGGITAVQRRLLVPASIGQGDTLIWLATVRDVATGGARSFTLDWGTNQGGNTVVFLADLHGWGGLVGGTGGSIYDHASTGLNSLSGSLVTQRAGGLLVGIAGGASGTLDPITASGWTKLDEEQTGNVVGTDSAAALFRKTGGALGSTQTLTASFNSSHTDLGVGLIELK